MEIKTLLITFITIMVGVALISGLGDNVTNVTGDFSPVNESLGIATARLASSDINASVEFSLAGPDLVSVSEVRWDNGTIMVENTDYVFNITNDQVRLLNSTANGNHVTTNGTDWDYTYRSSDYVASASSRTLLNLIPLFFVIGFFLIILVGIFKEDGFDFMKK